MQGKIVLITGSNSGIGKQTALELSKMGAHIIMFCRNEDKALKAKNYIYNISLNPKIDIILGDLSSFESIRFAILKIQEKFDSIDVLINNAGIFAWDRGETVDGLEKTMQVNYFSHFLLTNLLFPLLKKSEARIINLTSGIHKFFGINFKDLMSEKKYNPQKAYSNSKTSMILFTYELARRLKEFNILVNCVNPGHVETPISEPKSKFMSWFLSKMSPYRTLEEGAATSVYLASSNEIKGKTGNYYYKNQEIKSGKRTYNRELQEKLWNLSEKYCGSFNDFD